MKKANWSARTYVRTHKSEIVSCFATKKKEKNNLGLSCAKLKIDEFRIEDTKIFGLNENWLRNLKSKKIVG